MKKLYVGIFALCFLGALYASDKQAPVPDSQAPLIIADTGKPKTGAPITGFSVTNLRSRFSAAKPAASSDSKSARSVSPERATLPSEQAGAQALASLAKLGENIEATRQALASDTPTSLVAAGDHFVAAGKPARRGSADHHFDDLDDEGDDYGDTRTVADHKHLRTETPAFDEDLHFPAEKLLEPSRAWIISDGRSGWALKDVALAVIARREISVPGKHGTVSLRIKPQDPIAFLQLLGKNIKDIESKATPAELDVFEGYLETNLMRGDRLISHHVVSGIRNKAKANLAAALTEASASIKISHDQAKRLEVLKAENEAAFKKAKAAEAAEEQKLKDLEALACANIETIAAREATLIGSFLLMGSKTLPERKFGDTQMPEPGKPGIRSVRPRRYSFNSFSRLVQQESEALAGSKQELK